MSQLSVKRSFTSLGDNNPFAHLEYQCSPHRIQFLTSPNDTPKRQHTASVSTKRRLDSLESSMDSASNGSALSSSSNNFGFSSFSSAPSSRPTFESLDMDPIVATTPLKRVCMPKPTVARSPAKAPEPSQFDSVAPVGLDALVGEHKKKKYTAAEVEDLLSEQQTLLKEEFGKILNALLREQFENFSQFNHDYVSRQMKRSDFSYLS